MKKITKCFFGLLLMSAPALAFDHDLQNWELFIFQGPSDSRLRGYLEFQPRFGTDLQRTERVLVRPALLYAITPALTFWLGYGWTPALTPQYSDEARWWQQFQYISDASKLRLTHRLRFEERSIQDMGTAFRLRYMLKAELAFEENRTWLAVAYNELFLNFNSPSAGVQSGFDQNRLFIGVNRAIHPLVRLEAGYVNNMVHRPNLAQNRMNHVLFFGSYVTF